MQLFQDLEVEIVLKLEVGVAFRFLSICLVTIGNKFKHVSSLLPQLELEVNIFCGYNLFETHLI